MSLEDEIRSIAKEGADLSGVLGQLEGLNPMSGLTKDTAFEFIKQNPVLVSTFDAEVSKSVNSGVDNFKAKGMLEILEAEKKALRLELNPTETPAEKRVRELEDKLNSMELKEQLVTRQDELSTRAEELKFPSSLARELAGLGPAADSLIEKIMGWHNGAVGEVTKGNFIQKAPRTGGLDKGLTNMTADDLNAAALSNPNDKAAILSEILRRQKIT